MIEAEFLEPLGMTQAELARRLGVPSNRISQLVAGKRVLTAETALRLEKVLGIEAATWMNIQTACDLWEAQKRKPAKGLKLLSELKSA